jgi:hypothetical protein
MSSHHQVYPLGQFYDEMGATGRMDFRVPENRSSETIVPWSASDENFLIDSN